MQPDLPFAIDSTYCISGGRAAGILALEKAFELMSTSQHNYVLIGGSDAAVWHDGRFEGVRLGTDYAMADTLVALNDAAPVSVLPPLWDVDIPEDVARARTLGVLP